MPNSTDILLKEITEDFKRLCEPLRNWLYASQYVNIKTHSDSGYGSHAPIKGSCSEAQQVKLNELISALQELYEANLLQNSSITSDSEKPLNKESALKLRTILYEAGLSHEDGLKNLFFTAERALRKHITEQVEDDLNLKLFYGEYYSFDKLNLVMSIEEDGNALVVSPLEVDELFDKSSNESFGEAHNELDCDDYSYHNSDDSIVKKTRERWAKEYQDSKYRRGDDVNKIKELLPILFDVYEKDNQKQPGFYVLKPQVIELIGLDKIKIEAVANSLLDKLHKLFPESAPTESLSDRLSVYIAEAKKANAQKNADGSQHRLFGGLEQRGDQLQPKVNSNQNPVMP